MSKLILLLFQLVVVLLLDDLVAGAVHWLEDAYVREDTPLIGSFIGKANVIHHHLPRYLTRHNWWQSSWDLLAVSALIVFVAWRFQLLTWHVWWFAAVSANANEVHKWSHRTRSENGRLITWLQNLRVLQTPQHHAVHHTNPKNVRYCPITNLVNPLLDNLHFWDGLEWLLARTLSLHRRPGPRMAATPAGPAQNKNRMNPPAKLKSHRYWPGHNSARPGAAQL